MKEILVDSSVWIQYFSGKSDAQILDNLIDKNLICINDLILSELVPFLKQKKQNKIIELLYSIKNIPLIISWDDIINYQYINLKNGINNVGIPDLIILQNVIDNNLELLTFDKHFKLIQNNIKYQLFKLD
jgi:predicted nucleic acid-binding protein